MTMESTTRPLGSAGADGDLLAGLWEQAPFPRLPWDAPAELREFVEDVENPRRVYTIHRASRRHNFQLIVQQYIVQLREGCGVSTCCNPTCFTCRLRFAGRAPLRRYNSSSARTLAIHLASQDNPEAGLCPALSHSKITSAAVDSLKVFPKPSLAVGGMGKDHGPNKTAVHTHITQKNEAHETDKAHRSPTAARPSADSQAKTLGGQPEPPKFVVARRLVSKDYRSFAANLFDTVAFNMLEWLRPSSIADMVEKATSLQQRPAGAEIGGSQVPESKSATPTTAQNGKANGCAKTTPAGASANGTGADSKTASSAHTGHAPNPNPTNPTDAAHQTGVSRRNSNARVRTSNSKSQRKLSVDAYPVDATADELLPGLRSPRTTGLSGDAMNHKASTPKSLKTPASTIPRPISQLSAAGFFDGAPLDKMPPLKTTEIRPQSQNQTNGSQRSGSSSSSLHQLGSFSSRSSSSEKSPADQPRFPPDAAEELGADIDAFLPQTLARFDATVVDFVCDVLQQDRTAEQHLLEPACVNKFHMRHGKQARSLKRKQKPMHFHDAIALREEWRLFVEQSLFYVLSDPRALLRSFTKQGQLYDTQTLWYCMLRLTRVAPSLVFHSLWMAAEALFAPPKALQTLRSPTAHLFPRARRSLTNTEAGMIMSICFHALVAAAPAVDSVRKLYDMSRIRSNGLSLAGSGSVARQPAELCLQYDDAFSNELAMQLARRLLAAITTRHYFDEMADHELGLTDGNMRAEPDVLAPLFAQLDFLNIDAAYILDFSMPDRTLHETRMPTLLLDWARAVMLHEWDGGPVVRGDSPFGGALSLISAIYERRQALLVGDVQFRSEYFAERMDEVEMPVAWLSFTSSKQRLHLLDYPYIFSPETLVTYFRSINFSRMSRSCEESTSLQSRMNAIISPGSLVTNPHQKHVLQDLLKTASSKYLILDIGRSTVLQDAFDQLWRREERELMRPLKVHLGEESGEEGFDSGGVQQEFFRLAIAEALDNAYGAFTVDDRTRMAWFNPASLEENWKYELIGLLVSLAVYNGLSLPVTFPKALYRKLLGEPVTELHHISDGWPDLANGLTSLLEWNEQEGAVEDVFVRTYEFSVDMFGTPVTRAMTSSGQWRPLRESVLGSKTSATEAGRSDASGGAPTADGDGNGDGDNNDNDNENEEPAMVTSQNRNAYVSDYIQYLTDVSVRGQYEAFARGFRTCLHPKSLRLLTPALLQSLVEGQQEIDLAELRRHVRYVGWDASHRSVRDFWSIVARYDERMKRKLLEFVTASDRVPVGGVKNLHFVVQRNGEEEGEDGHLPTAYTCYGTLLLPEYPDRAVMQERLAMALENAQGFGFA